MRSLRSFAGFWYNFIVGDDWIIAIGVIAALAVTAAPVHARITAWLLMPLAVMVVLTIPLALAARSRR